MTAPKSPLTLLRDALTEARDALVDATISTSNDYDAHVGRINTALALTADASDQAPFDEDKLLQLFCNWECLKSGKKGQAAWEAIIAHIKGYRAGASDPAPDDVEQSRQLWEAALGQAAFYVTDHCTDGAYHAEAIMGMPLPTITARPAPVVATPAPDNRRCKPCGSTRGGDICWKCGASTFTPDPRAGDDPALPPVERIRALAKEVGYAIGVHGSQQRDFDVIAAPWTDSAIGNHALIEHLAKGLTTENGPAHIISTERKPLGRYAATIQMDGWYKPLDISVCPNEQYAALAAAPAAPTQVEPAPTMDQMIALMREAKNIAPNLTTVDPIALTPIQVAWIVGKVRAAPAAPTARKFSMTPALRKAVTEWGCATNGCEDADDHLLEVLNAMAPAAPIEEGKAKHEPVDAARFRWLSERFTGYDFYWGGKPDADTEEGEGKCVILFECGMGFKGGRDFAAGIDAALAGAVDADKGGE